LRGPIEKAFLKRLARASHDVFTASQPLHEEMSTWRLRRNPVLLPIGSNIPLTEADAASLRRRCGVAEEEIVLTLFGGGNSLKWSAGHVDRVEAALSEAGIAHCWLLLGGVPPDWFRLAARVLNPGRLSPADVSQHLRLTDIFLMPHVAGVSAKRGTLMAALQHGLPVVGTQGPFTDAFWAGVGGVRLFQTGDAAGLAGAVLALCRDRETRRLMGRENAEFFQEHFAWPRIARVLLDGIAVD
jgi:glycosyltransferase involved in cell wall biosynthesis